MPTERARLEWKNRVTAEYRSSAVTAQVLHGLIQCGLPDELLRTAIRIVGDELDHAELSFDVLEAIGGDPEPSAIDVNQLAEPVAPEGPFATVLDAIVRNFCLGETLAVPLFAAMREGTTHPVARTALDRILRDEAVHRAFGWDALDALIERDPEAVRQRVSAKLPAWLRSYAQGYGTLRPTVPMEAEELAVGLIPIERYVAVFQRCLTDDMAPRFNRRGIVPAV